MKTLGVTGGIGSGKTTVCHMLESMGARVFYADMVAKQLMETDPKVRAEIVEAFGPESYTESGALNRSYLSDKVFGNDDLVAKINKIVHPRVFARFEEEKTRAKKDGVKLLVEEAALIFESGADAHLDVVAVVDSPPYTRIHRVMERDEVPESKVRSRMEHQLPPEELRRRADFIIENDGTIEDLRQQVQQLYDRLVGSEKE